MKLPKWTLWLWNEALVAKIYEAAEKFSANLKSFYSFYKYQTNTKYKSIETRSAPTHLH